MPSKKIYINGKLVPAKEAKISVFDGGYLYGEGLFETMLAVEGRVPFLRDNYRRMKQGAKTIGLSLPINLAQLAQAIDKTLRANQLSTAYVRLNLSAIEADVGLKRSVRKQAQLVIFAKPFEPYPDHYYTKGARVIQIKGLINDPVHVATIKSTNYLVKRIARQQIQARGAAEGILLNATGHVSECASSNIFVVKRGQVRTPNLDEGLIPGVTRKCVMSLLKRRGITLHETQMSLKQVYQADEVFITSTLKGVMPIVKVEQTKIGEGRPGPLTQQLMGWYQKRLGMNFSK